MSFKGIKKLTAAVQKLNQDDTANSCMSLLPTILCIKDMHGASSFLHPEILVSILSPFVHIIVLSYHLKKFHPPYVMTVSTQHVICMMY